MIGDKKNYCLINYFLQEYITAEVSGIVGLAVKRYSDANPKSSVETGMLF